MPLYRITGTVETVIFAENKMDADIIAPEFLIKEVNDGGPIDVTFVQKINNEKEATRFLDKFPWNSDFFLTVREHLSSKTS